LEMEGTKNVVRANSTNATTNDTPDTAKNEEMMISQKQ